jgi:general stress protein 26
MHTPQEIEQKFWKALKAERTVMLGLDSEGGHLRPMTAMSEGGRGPIWFFASRDGELTQRVGSGAGASLAFASREHDLFATVQGRVAPDQDRAVIDHFWNPFVAAWFDGGKDDPRMALLRFDAGHAEIWLNASSVLAGVKFMLGGHPKHGYRDHLAKIDFR